MLIGLEQVRGDMRKGNEINRRNGALESEKRKQTEGDIRGIGGAKTEETWPGDKEAGLSPHGAVGP